MNSPAKQATASSASSSSTAQLLFRDHRRSHHYSHLLRRFDLRILQRPADGNRDRAAALASKTTLSAATTTPAPEANDAITITVASASSSSTTTPTGTLTIAVDGTQPTSSLALVNGSATYNFSSAAAGTHTIMATYSGDSIYASSSGSLSLTVLAKSFKLSATNLTAAAGSSGSSTVTITSQNGYTGTVAWAVSGSPSLTNSCFSMANTTVSGTSTTTATLTVNTVASMCASPAVAFARPTGHDFVAASMHIQKNEDTAPLAALHATHAGGFREAQLA